MATETYNIVTDFVALLGPLPYLPDLEDEVRASGNPGLVGKLLYTELIPGGSPADCLVTLSAVLTAPEKTVLDGVIAAHTAYVTNPSPPEGFGEPNGIALLDGNGLLVIDQMHPWIEDEFTPTVAQVTFIISQAPSDPTSLTFVVNGVAADETIDYALSGTTITWLNTPYAMETTDLVVVRYR